MRASSSMRPGGLTPMVKILIIANVAAYLLAQFYIHWIAPEGQAGRLLGYFVLYPPTFMEGQVWQILTYMFLHSFNDPMHLFFNMFVLWMFGSGFEPRWGSLRFLSYYLACGVGAGVAVILCYLLFPSVAMFNAPVLGASGATLAFVIAFAMYNPDAQILLFFVIPIRARYIALAVVVGDFVMGVLGVGIASHAHLGGMLTGWLLLTGYWDPRRWSRLRSQYQERRRQQEIRRRFRESMRDRQ